MTADEIATVERRLRRRLEELLSPAQLACYDGYQGRLARQIERHDVAPVLIGPAEHEVFALIGADSEARALRAQLDILTRVGVSRQ